jgi:anti-sigma-K factor RskA
MAWGTAAAALLAGFWTMHSKRTALEAQAHLISSFSESAQQLSQRLESSESARKECVAALQQLESDRVRVPLALSLLEDPATKVAPMVRTGAPDLRATALFNAEQKRALMISSSMRPVAGKDYELWIVASGPPQPAGFVRFDASGVAVGEFDAALLQGKPPAALAVSLEPAGGRPSPTEVVLMVKL